MEKQHLEGIEEKEQTVPLKHYAKLCALLQQKNKEIKTLAEKLQEKQQPKADAGWTTVKPDFKEECLVLTKSKIGPNWWYELYQVKKVYSDEGWYLGWLTGYGEEYGDLADMRADQYLILPLE